MSCSSSTSLSCTLLFPLFMLLLTLFLSSFSISFINFVYTLPFIHSHVFLYFSLTFSLYPFSSFCLYFLDISFDFFSFFFFLLASFFPFCFPFLSFSLILSTVFYFSTPHFFLARKFNSLVLSSTICVEVSTK